MSFVLAIDEVFNIFISGNEIKTRNPKKYGIIGVHLFFEIVGERLLEEGVKKEFNKRPLRKKLINASFRMAFIRRRLLRKINFFCHISREKIGKKSKKNWKKPRKNIISANSLKLGTHTSFSNFKIFFFWTEIHYRVQRKIYLIIIMIRCQQRRIP